MQWIIKRIEDELDRIARRTHQRRTKLGLTVLQVAKATGIHFSTINKIESYRTTGPGGHSHPMKRYQLYSLERYIDAIGLQIQIRPSDWGNHRWELKSVASVIKSRKKVKRKSQRELAMLVRWSQSNLSRFLKSPGEYPDMLCHDIDKMLWLLSYAGLRLYISDPEKNASKRDIRDRDLIKSILENKFHLGNQIEGTSPDLSSDAAKLVRRLLGY